MCKGQKKTVSSRDEVVQTVLYMSIIVQKDATIYSLFISVNYSTCFGWYLHPPSGAHITVSTASGISVTVTTTGR
jgi:hypothetical protein